MPCCHGRSCNYPGQKGMNRPGKGAGGWRHHGALSEGRAPHGSSAFCCCPYDGDPSAKESATMPRPSSSPSSPSIASALSLLGALPHLWRQDDAGPVVVRAGDSAGMTRGNPPPPRAFAWEADYGLEGLLEADIIVIPFWRDPAERPAQPCSMPWLPPGSGEPRSWGSVSAPMCWPMPACWTGAVPPPTGNLNRSSSSAFPGCSSIPMPLYVDDDGLITSAGTAASLDCCLYLVRQHHGSQIANKLARRLVVPPTGRWPGPVYRAAGARLHPGCQDQPAVRSPAPAPWPRPTPGQPGGTLHDEPTHLLAAASSSPPVSPSGWLMAERLRRSQTLLESSAHRGTHRRTGGARVCHHICANALSRPLRGVAAGWRRTFVVTESRSLMFHVERALSLPSRKQKAAHEERL